MSDDARQSAMKTASPSRARPSPRARSSRRPASRSVFDTDLISLANHMRLLLESTGEGIYGIDLNGMCTFINTSAAQMLGYSVEELVGRNMHDLIHHSHPDGTKYPSAECPVMSAFRLGRGCRMSTEVLWRKDGSSFPAEISSHPLNADGSIAGAVVTFNDITERRRAEEALDRQNRELLTLQRISEMILNARSLETAFQQIVQEVSAATAFPIVSIELHDPERRVMIFKAMAGLLSQIADVPFEVPESESLSGLVVRSGKLLVEKAALGRPEYIHSTLRLLGVQTFVCAPMTIGKNVIGAMSLASPEVVELAESFAPWITSLANSVASLIEKKSAEEQLREQAALLDHAQDAILVRDLNDRIVYWNRSAERLYGWSTEEVAGRSVLEVLYPGRTPHYQQAYETTLRSGEWHGELVHLSKDGLSILVESRWGLIHDSVGKPKSILVINTDVTENKQLEAELSRAEQLSLIGELAASLAHEIRNPLAGIQGAVDILIRRKDAGDPEREILEGIRNEVRRVDGTMRALLDLSRPRALALKPELLADVVRQAGSLARDHLVRWNRSRGRRIRLEIETSDNPICLPLDAGQIEDAILNLLLNAFEAIEEEGSVSLRVFQESDAQTGRAEALVQVHDTGRGIQPEHLQKIFSPFYSTTATGTGLGLPAVKRIVRAHGGRVEVKSKAGEGSIFTLHLPLASEPPK